MFNLWLNINIFLHIVATPIPLYLLYDFINGIETWRSTTDSFTWKNVSWKYFSKSFYYELKKNATGLSLRTSLYNNLIHWGKFSLHDTGFRKKNKNKYKYIFSPSTFLIKQNLYGGMVLFISVFYPTNFHPSKCSTGNQTAPLVKRVKFEPKPCWIHSSLCLT